MELEQKIKKESRRRAGPHIYSFDEESYASLSNGYWFTLLMSGLLFMWAFGYLGWRTGIGWFFLSNLISVLLVRFELACNSSVLLWHEKKQERFVENLLN